MGYEDPQSPSRKYVISIDQYITVHPRLWPPPSLTFMTNFVASLILILKLKGL